MNSSRMTVLLIALSLLLGGIAFTPTPAQAAAWISGADMFASDWVAKIEKELFKKEYRYVFANDPRAPQASILHLLNRAAKAQATQNETMARELAQEAVSVLEEGIRKHYYSAEDVEPILQAIKQHVPVKLS
ncbi:hypothetical protein [Nitrospira moscoviensis]|uniref:Uncharacterized protein n=1 Tax=Nitrospira moscoviensis TaxID=42253 RepID=A0A0K2GI13_NITMO|nr:hypothetical protein [Nitrospira moscoviensis]ALA60571.1 exported protein of unknown function [Nitrospira moscoviensis]